MEWQAWLGLIAIVVMILAAIGHKNDRDTKHEERKWY